MTHSLSENDFFYNNGGDASFKEIIQKFNARVYSRIRISMWKYPYLVKYMQKVENISYVSVCKLILYDSPALYELLQ